MRSSGFHSSNAPHFSLFHAICYYLVSLEISYKLILKCLYINIKRLLVRGTKEESSIPCQRPGRTVHIKDNLLE